MCVHTYIYIHTYIFILYMLHVIYLTMYMYTQRCLDHFGISNFNQFQFCATQRLRRPWKVFCYGSCWWPFRRGTCDKMSKSSDYRQKLWLKSDFCWFYFLKVISVPSSLRSLFPCFSMDRAVWGGFFCQPHMYLEVGHGVMAKRCYMWCFQSVTPQKT